MISRTSSISALALLLASAGGAAAFPATVTTDLNVRSGPGTGYGIVDQLQAGASVEVVQTSGSWYQLADGGWASGNYLDAAGSAAVDPGYEGYPDEYADNDYPDYYGTPAFYYGSDPYFWDDDGYYWYPRGGRRYRVSDDWWRGRDRNDFRWSNDNSRRDFQRRTRSADLGNDRSRRDFGNDERRRNFADEGPRRDFGNEGPRRNVGNEGMRRDVGNEGMRRDVGNEGMRRGVGNEGMRRGVGDGQRRFASDSGPRRSVEGPMRTGRASAEGPPRIEGRGSPGGGQFRGDGGGGRGFGGDGGGGRGGGGGGGVIRQR